MDENLIVWNLESNFSLFTNWILALNLKWGQKIIWIIHNKKMGCNHLDTYELLLSNLYIISWDMTSIMLRNREYWTRHIDFLGFGEKIKNYGLYSAPHLVVLSLICQYHSKCLRVVHHSSSLALLLFYWYLLKACLLLLKKIMNTHVTFTQICSILRALKSDLLIILTPKWFALCFTIWPIHHSLCTKNFKEHFISLIWLSILV